MNMYSNTGRDILWYIYDVGNTERSQAETEC